MSHFCTIPEGDAMHYVGVLRQRRQIVWVIAGLFVIAPAIVLAQGDDPARPAQEPQIQWIAHRGGVVDERHQEHSRPAIAEAIRRGYWMLEVDVRRTRDGHLIVHHDATFERYYGDPRQVTDITWDEACQLRSKLEGERPLDLEEFAAACRGKTRLMLDVKVEDAPASFFDSLEKTLLQHELLDSAYLIGSDATKKHFGTRVKVSVNGRSLREAIARQEDVAQRYFVFGVAAEIDEATVRLAQQHHVDVVPAVNTFRYPGANPTEQAARDIRRLRALGVTRFQIDSVYEPLFQAKPDAQPAEGNLP